MRAGGIDFFDVPKEKPMCENCGKLFNSCYGLTDRSTPACEDWIAKNEETKPKEVDYHAKSDFGKAKLSLVPRRIIWDVAAIREYGNGKYPDGGPDNWTAVEVERYRDAAYRHFLRYLDEPYSIDMESGYPHLWHLACNIAFLCEMEDQYLSTNPEVVRKLKKRFWLTKGVDDETDNSAK